MSYNSKNKNSTLPVPNPTASYWLKAPSPYLTSKSHSPPLPQSTDIIIVGSGIAGAFAAHHLLDFSHAVPASYALPQKQVRITMLEAREACSGATGRNGGHCAPKPYGKPIHCARFEIENRNYLRDFVQEHGIDCDWEDVCGVHAIFDAVLFARAKREVNEFKLAARSDERHMVDIVESKEGLRDLCLANGAVGAVLVRCCAALWPYRLVAFVLEALLRRSAASPAGNTGHEQQFQLHTNTAVTAVQRSEGGWTVHTSRGVVLAKQVLLATNAYTSYLLPKFSELITPVRGQMSALRPPTSRKMESRAFGPLSFGMLGEGSGDAQKDEYLIQRPQLSNNGGGELMFGGGRRFAMGSGLNISDDSVLDATTTAFLRNDLNTVLSFSTGAVSPEPTETSPLSPTFEWTGIMGFSRDGHPFVGPVAEELGGGEGLFVCAGFTGHGMVNAALCAKAVADMMLGVEQERINLPKEYEMRSARIAEVLLLPSIGEAKVSGAFGVVDGI